MLTSARRNMYTGTIDLSGIEETILIPVPDVEFWGSEQSDCQAWRPINGVKIVPLTVIIIYTVYLPAQTVYEPQSKRVDS
jgi:hypothetical protein